MITFYSVPTANGQKVAVLLELLGLAYEVRPIDLYAGEHLSDEFLKISPAGRAPAIVDDGPLDGESVTVYGTLAIALYLAEKTGRLMPRTAHARARLYDLASMLASDLTPALSGQFMFTEIMPQETTQVVDYFESVIHRMLQVVESHLKGNDFLVNSELSIADVLLYPIAATSLQRMPNAIQLYPAIDRWQRNLSEEPEIKRGMSVPMSAAKKS